MSGITYIREALKENTNLIGNLPKLGGLGGHQTNFFVLNVKQINPSKKDLKHEIKQHVFKLNMTLPAHLPRIAAGSFICYENSQLKLITFPYHTRCVSLPLEPKNKNKLNPEKSQTLPDQTV